MEEQFVTYTVKGRKAPVLWEFRYRLNGDLYSFTILEGQLNGTQMKWLFSGKNFPATERLMTIMWLKDKEITSKLEIKKTDLDLSFDAFWNTYNNKVGKKKMAESSWNNLSKANKIKALMAIPRYNNNLRLNPGIQKAYPTTFINQEYYNNEY
ncbi:hypothetical protein [Zunongwangia profunda]|uniref:hypothetical protein n=1 Tax=Zunongwangia profunda TaxID=398743 RepID=UPI00248F034C|nr:hypothetical protein [Zunongwangia profunda]|tara:strand:+ start:9351 stop:9809 length:459 start_codon:yes stop_codon:yes gene_type:complete